MNTNCRHRFLSLIVKSWMVLGAFGCSSPPEPGRMATYPVAGQVVVDGQPVEGLQVTGHEIKSLNTPGALKMTAMTDAQGKFQLSTYSPGDGVPEGEFALTFLWGKLNVISTQYEGPDQLNGRYSSPAESQFKFTSSKGKRVDLGKIELTTK